MTLTNPGQQQVKFPGKGSVTEFLLSTSPTLVLVDRSNTNDRRGIMIYNRGSANALFAYATTVSATAFTAELLPGGYAEDSPSFPWQGPIAMRSTAAPTNVNITELVTLI